MTYTPKQFLEDVRRMVVDKHGINLDAVKTHILNHNILHYRCDSINPEMQKHEALYKDCPEKLEVYGETAQQPGYVPNEIYVYGRQHLSKMAVAFTLIHELAHTVTPHRYAMENEGHSVEWATTALRLGIIELSGQEPAWFGEDIEMWSDPALYHAIAALPEPDWTIMEV